MDDVIAAFRGDNLTSRHPVLFALEVLRTGLSTVSDEAKVQLAARIPSEIVSPKDPYMDRDGRFQLALNTVPALKNLADAHLHAGGISLPLEIVCAILPGLVDNQNAWAQDCPVSDSLGTEFSIRSLLLGLAWTSLAITQPRCMAQEAERNGLNAEQVWSSCWRPFSSAQDARHVDSLRGIADSVLAVRDATGESPSLFTCLSGLSFWVDGSVRAQPTLAQNATIALCVLHAGLVVKPRSTLDVFLEQFTRQKNLRRDVSNRRRLRDGLWRMVRQRNLKRLELRNNASDSLTDLLDDVRDHVAACNSIFEDRPDMSFIAGMPVSFRRHNTTVPPSIPGELSLRYPLVSQLLAAEQVIEALLQHPPLAKLIGGFDVVGLESDAPSWVFSCVYSYVNRRLKEHSLPEMSFSVHAGENFGSSLNGLRRVGEVLDFPVPVARIGHGLGLGHARAPLRSRVAMSAYEAMQDLLWAASLSTRHSAELAGLASDLAERAFGTAGPIAADELLQYRSHLFDIDELTRVGIITTAAPLKTEDLVQRREIQINSISDLLLAATTTQGAFFLAGSRAELQLGAGMTAALQARYDTAEEGVLEEVRHATVERLRGGAVLEACPTSNVLLGGINSFAEHPLWGWLDSGLNVSINTDDPGLFCTSIEDEYVRLLQGARAGDISKALTEMAQTSNLSACPQLASLSEFKAICRSMLKELAMNVKDIPLPS